MPRILVLDDEVLIAALVEDWLAELGCETVGPASSITAAIELIESVPIDAAILDVTLGSETCYPVAEMLQARRIPFAFATGYGSAHIDARFTNAPVLQKPYAVENLKSALSALLPRP